MEDAELQGIFAVKLPVRDLARSRQWYERVLDFEVAYEFSDADGVVRGVAGKVPGSGQTLIGLRQSPKHAKAADGFNLVNFAVQNHAALTRWAARLDRLGVKHSPIIDASVGWIIVLSDPDGIELHLYTLEKHGIDQSGRPGYGTPTGKHRA
ncbi:VOC family protein [Glutamicibacter endophyticus]|uniref:VOC family protein n=1 Tax=Glutamicibacter endophyticus TaxID=1522174 RepID=UPI003AF07F85